jgi:hypothetical protein
LLNWRLKILKDLKEIIRRGRCCQWKKREQWVLTTVDTAKGKDIPAKAHEKLTPQ